MKSKRIKLNHPCPKCNKTIYLEQETAHTNKGVYHLECIFQEERKLAEKEIKDIKQKDYGGYWRGVKDTKKEFKKLINNLLNNICNNLMLNELQVHNVKRITKAYLKKELEK